MDKRVVVGGVSIVLALILILGFVIWQKSQAPVKPEETKKESLVKKVDLASQPEWVQKLTVTVTKGSSANGLKNFTMKVTGLPKDLVQSVDYIVQYETTNKGSQGALSTKPLDVKGATEFSKTIDLGSCSTKTCVTFDGVTAVETELDFITSDSSKFSWTGTLDLK
jgi:hypothetical protein